MSGWFDPIWNYLTRTRRDIDDLSGIFPTEASFRQPSMVTSLHDWRRVGKKWMDCPAFGNRIITTGTYLVPPQRNLS